MEFLDPKKRRAHRKKLFLGYGLIAIALAMMTVIVVFATYGFDIDRKTGQVIQNGMIIVDAHPEAARISINGKDQGSTSKRLPLPAGQYHVELARDGYRTWTQNVDLAGSSIEQLVYPFLFPSNLATNAIRNYNAAPRLVSQSPDRQWLVVESPGSKAGTFQVIDLNDETNPSTEVVLPSTLLSSGKKHTFTAVEWSTDNTNILLKHTYDTQAEFIVLNRDKPANSQNITKLFPQRAFTSVSLYDKRPDQFYLYNSADKSLHLANAKSKSISLALESVLQYKTYQRDMVLYVTAATDTTKADIRLRYKGVDRVIKTVAVSPRYLLDVADFSGKMYVAVGSTNEEKAYLFLNPLDVLGAGSDEVPQAFRALKLASLESIAFSTNARFLEVQAGSKFAVFDAETNRQYRYDTQLPASGRAATWMDGHRLAFIGTDKQVYVFDFDGTNKQRLNAGVAKTDVYFDRDYTALYVIAPGGSGDNKVKASLTRTELKVAP